MSNTSPADVSGARVARAFQAVFEAIVEQALSSRAPALALLVEGPAITTPLSSRAPAITTPLVYAARVAVRVLDAEERQQLLDELRASAWEARFNGARLIVRAPNAPDPLGIFEAEGEEDLFQAQAPAPAPAPVVEVEEAAVLGGTAVLDVGARGPAVLFVQEVLRSVWLQIRTNRRISFETIATAQPESDGVYGPHTAECVRAFQRANGFEPNGIVDARTYAALSSPHSREIDPVDIRNIAALARVNRRSR